VVCNNERLGADQRSCVGSGNLGYIKSIKNMLKSEGLDIPVIERECLSRCEEGPVMRIAPGGRVFTEINQASLVEIIDELKSLLAGKDSKA
jgi:(2Fe-2S) ferredoxin